MDRHILYIINPISGTRDKEALRTLVAAQTEAAGIRYTIQPTAANGDYAYLDAIIRNEKVTEIVIAGGDGTINSALSGLRHWELPFGFIPCGSGNGLALSAGLSRVPAKALEVIFARKSAPTDAFLINGKFACMLCGLGFDAQVAHDFANDPARGLNTYIKKTVAHFFNAPTYPFEIAINGEWIRSEAFFISIANSNQFGNNVTIAPHANLRDGLLDIVLATRQNRLSLLMTTMGQLFGLNRPVRSMNGAKDAGVLYFQTDALQVRNPGGAPLHIDGDPAETATEFDICILKHAYQLFVP
jgi:diacylglycerol kinase (ATP)